jgi:outer membrane protein TolC
MKGLLIVLAAVLAAQAREMPADSLDLASFLQRAWQTAESPVAARHVLAAALDARRQAAARRAPVLGFDLATGWVSRTQELDIPGRSISFGDGRTVDAALAASWTLYAGGALRAGEVAAAAQAVVRDQELMADSLRLAGELRVAWLEAMVAQAAWEATALSLGRLQRHHEELGRRRAAGLGGEEAELLAESRLLTVRQEEERRRGAMTVARLELGSLCGSPGRAVVPRGDLGPSWLDPGLPPIRPAALGALDARLSVAGAVEAERAAALRPRLEAGTAWHLARPGVDPITNEWMDYGSAQLRLRWTLWDHGLGRLRRSEAAWERRALEQRLAEAERRQVARLAAVLELRRSEELALDQAARRVQVEERRLELVESRWREGMATEREWLDAADDARQARLEEILGAARLRLAENQLRLAKGR